MKTILLTGANGFLGSYLMKYLQDFFYIVSLSRSSQSDIVQDLSVQEFNLSRQFDFVIHSAGLAHMYPKNDLDKESFDKINVKGTAHLLSALEQYPPKIFVFISSVSVYGLDSGMAIDETSPLYGTSPYAKSKIQAEELVKSWCEIHKVSYLILRLPLIVGQNAPGNLGKMEMAISRSRYLRLAEGKAQKSAVLASDVAILIRNSFNNSTLPSGIYNLTDGVHSTFFELEEAIRKYYSKPPIVSIPEWSGWLLGKIGDLIPIFPFNSNSFKKITCTYTFSDAKARQELNWSPSPILSFYDAK